MSWGRIRPSTSNELSSGMMSITLAPGCTTAPIVCDVQFVDDAVHRGLQVGAAYAVLRGFDVFIQDGQVALRFGQIFIGLRSKRGECVRDFRLSLRELPAHFGRLAVKPQHLDFGHDFLFVQLDG